MYIHTYIYIYIFIIILYMQTYDSIFQYHCMSIFISSCTDMIIYYHMMIFLHISLWYIIFTYYQTHQRKFSSTTSDLRTNIEGQSFHHVFIMVMSSSCQQHVVIIRVWQQYRRVSIRERVNWGARKPVFFRVMLLLGRRSILFPRAPRCRRKVHETRARARLWSNMFGGLLEDEVGRMCTRL